MRILHFGTFDVPNYGDLLFPLILEKRLADLQAEFVHVSPAGGGPVWADCVPTVAARTVLRDGAQADAVIVGGGHIVHGMFTRLKYYQAADHLGALVAYPSLWLGASYLAARSNAALVWNAPGIPHAFGPLASKLAAWAAGVTDYLAVRDDASRSFLVQAGVSQPVHVVPDTALEVVDLWPAEALAAAYRAAFEERGQAVPRRSVAFHLNARYVDDASATLAARLDDMAAQLDAQPILLAIGPCHNDDALAREVGQHMRSRPLVVDVPRGLREIAACIGHSEAYLGSSMHGFVTACSFGRRALLVASADIPKFKGLLAQLDLEPWLCATWDDAARLLPQFTQPSGAIWKTALARVKPLLDDHWARVRTVLLNPSATRSSAKAAALVELSQINASGWNECEIYQGILLDQAQPLQKALAATSNFSLPRSILSNQLSKKLASLDETVAALVKQVNERAARGRSLWGRLCDWLDGRPKILPDMSKLVVDFRRVKNDLFTLHTMFQAEKNDSHSFRQ